jgi:hypothetical protein
MDDKIPESDEIRASNRPAGQEDGPGHGLSAEQISAYMRAVGRLGASKGGKARAKALTAAARRRIARRAIRARWEKVRAAKQTSL